jgi:hypothetical protein
MPRALSTAEAKSNIATEGRATAKVDHDGVDRLLKNAFKIGGTISNRSEDEQREAGLPESLDAVFDLGLVPMDEEDGVHQCRRTNKHSTPPVPACY